MKELVFILWVFFPREGWVETKPFSDPIFCQGVAMVLPYPTICLEIHEAPWQYDLRPLTQGMKNPPRLEEVI